MALGDVSPEAIGKGGIVLEDDVWIGYRATILDGVTIRQRVSTCWALWRRSLLVRLPQSLGVPFGLSYDLTN